MGWELELALGTLSVWCLAGKEAAASLYHHIAAKVALVCIPQQSPRPTAASPTPSTVLGTEQAHGSHLVD